MKTMMRTGVSGVLAAGLLLCGTVQAAFESRLSGQAYYDTALDITWLADANAGAGSIFDDGSNTVDGRMSWSSALDWANSLTLGGSTAWRLPSLDRNGDGTIIDCAGAGAGACADNEYGHLFHLGGIDSMNSAPFSNVGTVNYWSATADGSNAWLFDFTFNDGSQFTTSQTFKALAWAVHDGDIALVPLPAAVWLLSGGLIGLLLGRRRHAAAEPPNAAADRVTALVRRGTCQLERKGTEGLKFSLVSRICG